MEATNVTAVTSQWFETRVRYEKTSDNGRQRAVTEQYVVEAMSFTEAEAAITKEISYYVSSEFSVKTITPASYGEVFFSGDEKWYQAKVVFITLDEKTGKEKKSSVAYLVEACSFNAAIKNIDKVFAPSMIDYCIASVKETALLDVIRRINPIINPA